MTINCVIISDSSHTYIPRRFLEREIGDNKPIILYINNGIEKVVVKKLNTTANYPGLDKSYIELLVEENPKIIIGDWLSLQETTTQLRVQEIIKT